jgi:hypothetical protein
MSAVAWFIECIALFVLGFAMGGSNDKHYRAVIARMKSEIRTLENTIKRTTRRPGRPKKKLD